MPVINILIFLGGLVLLVKGSDLFVLTSSRIARRFGVSEFVIGLTLVSVGTSVPELASSLTASFQQASGIVMGNILGSNIANIGLIASTAALLTNIKTEEVMLRRDGYIMLFASVLLFLFMLDFEISRLEALIFILFYLAYLLFLLDKVKRHEEEIYFKDFMIYFFKFEYLFDLKSRIKPQVQERGKRNRNSEDTKKGTLKTGKRAQKKHESESEIEMRTKYESESKIEMGTKNEPITELRTKSKTEPEYYDIDIDVTEEKLYKASLLIEFLKLIASGAAIIIGAKYFVEQAVFFALLLEVPETLIGISLVAVGTSVPELMVTISAARSDYAGIALGNVIGSNIANTLLILGCAGLVHPIMVTSLSIYYIAPFMLMMSFLLILFIRTGWRVKQFEGLILLLLYLSFMVLILRLG
ncbi:calcium/sodium antiporter [Methanosarcina barkeri]|uniref:Sodium/calcium exchanger protein n=2 Tax=Methanosarcina barkeri TaxID=2208 RepID=A0A0E3QVF1_METBA|nr:calcium/sodium antiporter [Methanosarcina barkeri]AKB54750.1 Sodium/calcium exchanger protein [Methanosarcina barkeri MS]AKJ37731.1 sodium/calcium exchanger protein [Methanosarcina barkeri CM1]